MKSLALGLWLCLATPAFATPPNILVILTDDQRADTLSVMPNVQALAATGVRFTNAFVTTSLCGPSRASFLTGRYAHHTGYTHNVPTSSNFGAFDATQTVATALHAAGYRTGWFGKYLNGYETLSPAIPPGWDAWHVFKAPAFYSYTLNENGTEVPYGGADADYSTDVLQTKALAFLPGTQPFFLVVAPYAPHALNIPAPRHVGHFATLAPLRPPSWKEAGMSDKPLFWRAKKDAWTSLDEVSADQFRREQLETLLAVDEAVGALVAAAPANTIIIFTSDNGMSWGEHWQYYQKKSGYDEQIRVPLVIAGPGVVPHVEDKLALTLDLLPTLLHVAGATSPLVMDGKDLSPLLAHQAPPWRDDFLIEGWHSPVPASDAPAYVGVVASDGWKYLKTTEDSGATVEELYDRVADPYEMTDKAETTHGRVRRTELRARLGQLQAVP